ETRVRDQLVFILRLAVGPVPEEEVVSVAVVRALARIVHGPLAAIDDDVVVESDVVGPTVPGFMVDDARWMPLARIAHPCVRDDRVVADSRTPHRPGETNDISAVVVAYVIANDRILVEAAAAV